MHKLLCLHVRRPCVCVRGSPRGLPRAYHTQAVRDELPERGGGERERKKGWEGEEGGVVCAAVSALFV